ncbi:hypothetical protein ACFL4G_12515 [Thermodesulfobacteriota bacterium]
MSIFYKSYSIKSTIYILICFSVAFLASPCNADDPYPGLTKSVKDAAINASNTIIMHLKHSNTINAAAISKHASTINNAIPTLTIYSIMDAVIPTWNDDFIEDGNEILKTAHDTARTDKQTETIAGSGGGTTLTEKPGAPSLLSFAIENGAIQQEERENNLTLSSSPYAFIALPLGDTLANYRKFEILWRLGFSATIPLNEERKTSIGDLDLDDITSWSIRYQIFGDRSSRSKRFYDEWEKSVKSDLTSQAVTYTKHFTEIYNIDTKFNSLRLTIEQDLQTAIISYLDLNKTDISNLITVLRDKKNLQASKDAKDELLEGVKNVILEYFFKNIYDQIKDPTKIKDYIEEDTVKYIKDVAAPDIKKAIGTRREINAKLNEIYNSVQMSDIWTVEYTHNKDPMGCDYSDVKLLYTHNFRNMYGLSSFNITINGAISVNHNPDPTEKEEDLRGAHCSVELETSFDNPIPLYISTMDKTPVIISFSGEYKYLETQEKNMWSGLGKLEIPVSSGFSLPLTISYINRTETKDEEEFRFNFGMDFDFDKLITLAKAAKVL